MTDVLAHRECAQPPPPLPTLGENVPENSVLIIIIIVAILKRQFRDEAAVATVVIETSKYKTKMKAVGLLL